MSSRQRVMRQVLPAAVAAAGIGHHHGVGAVRQQVRARAERVRASRSGAPSAAPPRRASIGTCSALFDRRILQRHQVRDPLLEQQLGRLDPRIGVEAALHRRGVERVVEREQAHALVMRHVGRRATTPPRGVRRQPLRRVVDRLVEAVAPGEAFAGAAARGSRAPPRARAAPPAAWRTARSPGRRPGRASGRGRARRRPGTDSCPRDPARCRPTRRCPTARRGRAA